MLSVTGADGATMTCPVLESAAAVAERVAAERDALLGDWFAHVGATSTDPQAQAARARRMAMLRAREAGWWGVLLTATRGQGVPPIWRAGAVIARHHARDDARFWRELATDWQSRADKRPTSDAAGALSNWAELGITP